MDKNEWDQLVEAAAQGDAIAQGKLGVCYYEGDGVRQNFVEAVKWFQESAKQGNSIAQYNLGLCYESGQGVSMDHSKAALWFRQAANQGDADAQFKLGIYYANGYENGFGVSRNIDEAKKWFYKAAKQGIQEAADWIVRLDRGEILMPSAYDATPELSRQAVIDTPDYNVPPEPTRRVVIDTPSYTTTNSEYEQSYCRSEYAENFIAETAKLRTTGLVIGGIFAVLYLFTGGFHIIGAVILGYTLFSVPFGWAALTSITPRMFIFMPIIGWLIYFGIKFLLSIAVGIFAAPIRLIKAANM